MPINIIPKSMLKSSESTLLAKSKRLKLITINLSKSKIQ